MANVAYPSTSPRPYPTFTLADTSTGNDENRIVFPLYCDVDSSAEYHICRVEGTPTGSRFAVRLAGLDGEAPEEDGSVLAVLVLCPPILRISAIQSGTVFVVPGHLKSSSPSSCSPKAWQVMMLDTPKGGCYSYTLLRPGDFIRLSQGTLRVDMIENNTNVQVGSSNPAVPGDEEVSDILDAQRIVQDCFRGDSQSWKLPVVAETPASRQKYRDAKMTFQDEAPNREETPSQQIAGSMPKRIQFDQSYTHEAEESQELLGSGTLKPVADAVVRGADLHRAIEEETEAFPASAAYDGTAEIPEYSIICGPSTYEHEYEDFRELKEGTIATYPRTDGMFLDGEGSAAGEEKLTAPATLNDETASDTSEDLDKIAGRVIEGGNIDDHPPDLSPLPVKKDRKRKSHSEIKAPASKKRRSESPEALHTNSALLTPRSSRTATSTRVQTRLSSSAEEATSQPGSRRASSTRSASHTVLGLSNSPRMVFSNSKIPTLPQMMKFLTQQGAKQVEKVTAKSFDVLIVGTGELKKTSKLLTALAIGKPVVTDEWVRESEKSGKLLNTSDFTPKDESQENELEFDFEESQRLDRRNLFEGKSIFMTPALKREYGSGFSDFETLAKLTGTKRVVSKPIRNTLDDDDKTMAETIYIGCEKYDSDAQLLIEHGRICYMKDLISKSILRGILNLDDEKMKITLSSQRRMNGKGGRTTR